MRYRHETLPLSSVILRQGSQERRKCSTYLPALEEWDGSPGRPTMPHKKQWGSSAVCSGELRSAIELWQVPSLVARSEQRSLEECDCFHCFED